MSSHERRTAAVQGPLRSDGTLRRCLALLSLSLLSLCASSSLVAARAVPTTVVGSVNVIYLAAMQQVSEAEQKQQQQRRG